MKFYLRTQDVRNYCIQEIEKLFVCDPPKHIIEIGEYKKSKTGQQRAYFHAVLHEICKYTGDDVEEVKMQIKYRILPLKQVKVNERIHLYPISSEEATVEQYSQLIESALIYAGMAGIAVPDKRYFGIKE